MRILGIHGNFYGNEPVNESSVALIEDGVVLKCVAEERLTRKKVDGSFPENAIKDVLTGCGLTINDIDAVAITELPPAKSNYKYFRSALSTYSDTGVFLSKKIKSFAWNTLYNIIKSPGKKVWEYNGKTFNVTHHDHHYCHAAGAYYCSPFDSALVITLDGGGDGLDGGAYIAIGTQLNRFSEIPHFQSPGTMYSAITHDLGFKRHRHEGKITGLAAFGNPDLKRLGLENLLKYNPKKQRFVSAAIAAHHRNLNANSNYFYPLLSKFSKEDLAAATQEIFEKEVLAYINDMYHQSKKLGKAPENICLAGGCFANVKLNQRIFELGHFKNIYVFPAMGDDGLSVGAALLKYYSNSSIKQKTPSVLKSAYLGNSFSDKDIEAALANYGLAYEKTELVENSIAKYLADGKVVARFNGAMEYGPRALGNRSVIAAPFDKSINDWLNKKFKRTEFMPFAPSMLIDYASDYLENYNPSTAAADYMTITYSIKKGMAEKIPAVVHVDNTARPQIVRKETNESYYKIIEAFQKLTGIAVVLNTSFNMHEEPIVYTPDDAIRAFLDAELDVLAMGNYLVTGTKN